MNTSLLNVIERIITEQGEAILTSPQRLKGLISDYAKNEPKPERLAFGRCIEYGFYGELKKAAAPDERVRVKAALAQRLHNEEGLDMGFCAGALDLLEAVIWGVQQQKIFCANCGEELQEGWNSCPYCSAPVSGQKQAATPSARVRRVSTSTVSRKNTDDGNVDIYVVGLGRDPTYWKNGEAVALTSGGRGGEVKSIFVAGTDVYVAGCEYTGNFDQNNFETTIATYWQNGQAVALTDRRVVFSEANSIFVAGRDVYVAGRKGIKAVYWKNGEVVALTNEWTTVAAEANSIFVAGRDVYVAGHDGSRATYWKNGQAVALTDMPIWAISIFVVEK